jgi:chromosome segregation ATPase
MKERYAKANKELEKNEEELTEKDRKLKSMEKDVRRHKERQKIEDQALLQEVRLPYMQYIEEKNKHDKAKIDRNNAKEKIVRLREQNAPLENQKR